MTTSSKETDSRGPAVLKILNVKPLWGVYRSLMQSALYTISARTENPPKNPNFKSLEQTFALLLLV